MSGAAEPAAVKLAEPTEDLILNVTIPATAAQLLNGQVAKIAGVLQAAAWDLVRDELKVLQRKAQQAEHELTVERK